MTDNSFEKAERDHEEFLKRIENTTEQKITGLVDAGGSGGGKGDSDVWDLTFHLAAWRDSSGNVHKEEVRVEIPVSDEELSDLMEAIHAYSLVNLRVKIADHPNGRKQAMGSALPTICQEDEELSKVAVELQKPVVFSDPKLGEFTLDRSLNWFRGNSNWLSNQIGLSLSASEQEEVRQCLEVARALWEYQSDWDIKISDFAVEHLLDGLNDNWLEEGESPVTPDSFKQRMTLQSITVYPDGEFSFWHDDGDLFWGHAIQVSGNLTDGPTDVDTPG